MLTDEQKALRWHGIGSSEVAAVIGLNNYRTPTDVWLEKVGLVEPFGGNEATEIGENIEAWIAERYAQSNQCHSFVPWFTVVCAIDGDEFDFCLATPDYLIEPLPKKWSILEIKNVGHFASKDWDTDKPDGVPPYVYAQVQWQMFVTGIHKAVVCAFLGGSKIRWWNIDYNENFACRMAIAVEKFWNCHVLPTRLFHWLDWNVDIPPDNLDGSYLKVKYPESDGCMLEATPATIAYAKVYNNVKSGLEEFEKELVELKSKLIEIIGDADGIEGICTYKTNKNGRRSFRFIYKPEDEE